MTNEQHLMWATLERALAALQACNHLPSGPQAGWCNVCGAVLTQDGRWIQPHWRDLMIRVLSG